MQSPRHPAEGISGEQQRSTSTPAQWRMSIAAFTMFRSGQRTELLMFSVKPKNLVIPSWAKSNEQESAIFGCPILVALFATGWELWLWLPGNLWQKRHGFSHAANVPLKLSVIRTAPAVRNLCYSARNYIASMGCPTFRDFRKVGMSTTNEPSSGGAA